MIFNHASDKREAIQQINDMDQKAYNYDLILVRCAHDTFPILKKIPALIKDDEDKIFQWGNLNGEWQLTELVEDNKEAFLHLNFPHNSNASITLATDQITREMYDILKKAHTVAHFDLGEYLSAATYVSNKYPINQPIPDDQHAEFNIDSHKIGKAQKKFPAWLAGLWCLACPFAPIPDFKKLIKNPNTYYLKLSDLSVANLRQEHLQEVDFFRDNLGKDHSLYKGNGALIAKGTLISRDMHGTILPNERDLLLDMDAMRNLDVVMSDELNKFKRLLNPTDAPNLS
jgi:hypothetical protein